MAHVIRWLIALPLELAVFDDRLIERFLAGPRSGATLVMPISAFGYKAQVAATTNAIGWMGLQVRIGAVGIAKGSSHDVRGND
ncbi:MAG TPA: hypothetical protein DHU96_14235 [Actinobacteria bacterium]|nr:hypothetical protein [Actinomycetota bacterium]